jgi:hypothetical protein
MKLQLVCEASFLFHNYVLLGAGASMQVLTAFEVDVEALRSDTKSIRQRTGQQSIAGGRARPMYTNALYAGPNILFATSITSLSTSVPKPPSNCARIGRGSVTPTPPGSVARGCLETWDERPVGRKSICYLVSKSV